MKSLNNKNIFKTIGVCTLSAFMLATSLFAFLPASATAETISNNNLNNSANKSNDLSSESSGLINPRADDPVLFTTESGLEIKYGNATIQPSLESGNLAGFPYFTTNDGSSDYTWVIIGQSSLDKKNYFGSIKYVLSDWKNTTGIVNKDYFSDNLNDVTSAGAAINTDSKFLLTNVMDTIKYSDEITENCVLVLANTILGTGSYGTITYLAQSNYAKIYNYNHNTLMNAMTSMYSNGTYGLSSIKSSIIQVDLLTPYSYFTSDATPSSIATKSITLSGYIFPLGGTSGSSFYINSYLNVNQRKLTDVSFWLRGGAGYKSGGDLISNNSWTEFCATPYCVNSLGTISGSNWPTASLGYRPAFVMSLA